MQLDYTDYTSDCVGRTICPFVNLNKYLLRSSAYCISGGPCGTVPEPLFEKKGLITALWRLLVGYQKMAE
jgi:hypothetical protein